MKRLIVFLMMALVLQSYAAELFKQGERVVFLGDSITHGGYYIYNVELFQALRYPGSKVVILNAGISGDNAGGGVKRLDYDVIARNPDRIFVMFGMNDVGRSNYQTLEADEAVMKRRESSLVNYKKNQTTLVENILKAGKALVMITPSPYDQYGEFKSAKLAACNDPGLANCTQIVKELAAAKQLPVVDFFVPMTELLKKYPEMHLAGKDRVHPGPGGHLIMAAILVKEMGGQALVGEVVIDAKAGTVQAENAGVENLQAGDRSVSFKYSPKALPFPALSKEYKEMDAIYPVTLTLNQELLKVTNLVPGNYVLKTGNKVLGTFSAADFAAGVNLALLETPSQMIATESDKVVKKMRDITGRLRSIVMMNRTITGQGGNPENFENACETLDKWLEKMEKEKSSALNYFKKTVENYKKDRPQEAELNKQVDDLREELWKTAQPVPFEISLTLDK